MPLEYWYFRYWCDSIRKKSPKHNKKADSHGRTVRLLRSLNQHRQAIFGRSLRIRRGGALAGLLLDCAENGSLKLTPAGPLRVQPASKKEQFVCVCVCVQSRAKACGRACVRARARVCVCVCVCVCACLCVRLLGVEHISLEIKKKKIKLWYKSMYVCSMCAYNYADGTV